MSTKPNRIAAHLDDLFNNPPPAPAPEGDSLEAYRITRTAERIAALARLIVACEDCLETGGQSAVELVAKAMQQLPDPDMEERIDDGTFALVYEIATELQPILRRFRSREIAVLNSIVGKAGG